MSTSTAVQPDPVREMQKQVQAQIAATLKALRQKPRSL